MSLEQIRARLTVGTKLTCIKTWRNDTPCCHLFFVAGPGGASSLLLRSADTNSGRVAYIDFVETEFAPTPKGFRVAYEVCGRDMSEEFEWGHSAGAPKPTSVPEPTEARADAR